MKIQEAIAKAQDNKRLIGEYKGGLKVEAVIPAPTNDELRDIFINEFRLQEVYNGIESIDFISISNVHLIADADYDVFIVFEGTLHDSPLYKNGDILGEWLHEFTA